MALTGEHLDTLTELLNVGVGRAADVLNQMIEAHVTLSVPSVRVVEPGDLVDQFFVDPKERLSSVCMEFAGGFAGATSMVFTMPCAVNLVEALTGERAEGSNEMDSMRMATLIEVGNILINGVMGSIANILDTHIEYQVPQYTEGTVGQLVQDAEDPSASRRQVVVARTKMTIDRFEVVGDIVLCVELGTLGVLIDSLVAAA